MIPLFPQKLKINIKKRSTTLTSATIFLLISLAFLHFLSSLYKGISPVEISSLKSTLFDNWWLFLACFWTIKEVRNGKTYSIFFFLFYCFLTLAKMLFLFLDDFNKLILVFGFLFFLMAFWLGSLLYRELKESIYRPGFLESDIDFSYFYNFSVLVKYLDQEINGVITNCSAESCFVSINNFVITSNNKVELILNYEGKKFLFEGEIHTYNNHGLGIKIKRSIESEENFGWEEFLDVITDRSFLFQEGI